MQFDVFMPHLKLCYLYLVHSIHLLKRKRKKYNFDQQLNCRLSIGGTTNLNEHFLYGPRSDTMNEETLLNENSTHNH